MWCALPEHFAARPNLFGNGSRSGTVQQIQACKLGIRPRDDCHLQIALELDQQERTFMAEGGMESEDYLKYMAEDSGNVAADGNFSVQVCFASWLEPHGTLLTNWCMTLYTTLAISCLHAVLPGQCTSQLACSICHCTEASSKNHTQQTTTELIPVHVKVLAKALEVWSLNLEPLDAPNMRQTAQHPEQEDAFICNLEVSMQAPDAVADCNTFHLPHAGAGAMHCSVSVTVGTVVVMLLCMHSLWSRQTTGQSHASHSSKP